MHCPPQWYVVPIMRKALPPVFFLITWLVINYLYKQRHLHEEVAWYFRNKFLPLKLYENVRLVIF
jgi:hypothetical protein